MERPMWWLVVLACQGPGPDETDGDGETDGDADTDTDTDADIDTDVDLDCDVWGFGEAVGLALPNPLGTAVDDQLDAVDGSTTTIRWSGLHDFTDDGIPDLVVTDVDDALDDEVSGNPGHTAWAVYAGSATGFGAVAAAWSLPSGEPAALFTRLDSSGSCAADGDARRWATYDLDADGFPDLVITERCDQTDVGTDHWDVHLGTATGFSATVTPFVLPDYGPLALSRADQPDASGAISSWLADMDADGRLDLVVAADDGDPDVGRTEWAVHKGSATGFGAAVAWPLSTTLPCDVVLDAPDASFDCTGDGIAEMNYAVRDLDDDGRPDLVVSAGGGTAGWALHRNTGSGFAAATAWALPAGLREGDLVVAYTTPSSWTGCYAYGLYDLTGDGQEDLVVADSCEDQEVGVSRWDVYRGEAAGFASVGLPFTLPTGFGAGSFDHPEKPTFECASSTEDWRLGLYDPDGDGVVGLANFEACEDAAIGTTAWRAWPVVCLTP